LFYGLHPIVMSSLAITSIAKSWTLFVGAGEENVVRLGEQRIH